MISRRITVYALVIRDAGKFGFKVYYGDGTRLDVLRQSGADVVMVRVDDRKATDRIVELVKADFPTSKLLVRSFDRGHAIQLRKAEVDFEIRETFESALIPVQPSMITMQRMVSSRSISGSVSVVQFLTVSMFDAIPDLPGGAHVFT